MKVDVRGSVQLLLLAMACTLLWRIEVEVHGWQGLVWLSYFHWAVPIGAAAFLAWAARSDLAPPGWKRALFLLAAGAYAAVALMGTSMALSLLFVTGPSAMFVDRSLGLWLIFGPTAVATVAIPTGAFILARLLGARLLWRTLPVSVALAVLAGPGALSLLHLVDADHADDIHTVKTGAAIPFVVLALGLPWVVRGRERPRLERSSSGDAHTNG